MTSILRNRGRILILKRSDKVGSYQGSWAGVSGFVEKDETYEEAARREIVEETGLGKVRFSRMTPSRSFRDDDSVWTIHPFLFDVSSRTVNIDWEHDAYAWIVPDELKEYPSVPGLHAVIKNLLEQTNL
ncbi:MAG: NUDIX pyrophosphatase [Thermoplasmata archaeon]